MAEVRTVLNEAEQRAMRQAEERVEAAQGDRAEVERLRREMDDRVREAGIMPAASLRRGSRRLSRGRVAREAEARARAWRGGGIAARRRPGSSARRRSESKAANVDELAEQRVAEQAAASKPTGHPICRGQRLPVPADGRLRRRELQRPVPRPRVSGSQWSAEAADAARSPRPARRSGR